MDFFIPCYFSSVTIVFCISSSGSSDEEYIKQQPLEYEKVTVVEENNNTINLAEKQKNEENITIGLNSQGEKKEEEKVQEEQEKPNNQRQHQSVDDKKQTETTGNRKKTEKKICYSPIYQPHNRDILNTSKFIKNSYSILASKQNINNFSQNHHNFNRINPTNLNQGITPKNRPKSLDPDNDKLNNKVSSNNNKIYYQNKDNFNKSSTQTTAKPKSPHPVRRLQSFIHQKNRDRQYLVKKRSASDDDDDDYSDDDRNRVNRRNSSFTPRLAPVTSPASTGCMFE